MRVAAQQGEWDYLCLLGTQYHQEVEALRCISTTESLSTDEHAERMLLLREILQNDAEVRNLAVPELARIGVFLTRVSKKKTVISAYRQHTGI